MYDFDQVIDRSNTPSTRHNSAKRMSKKEGIIPLWIADMDFAVPNEVQAALSKAVDHGIFGYHFFSDEYKQAVNDWFSSNYDFAINPEWIVQTPGIVAAVCVAIQSMTEEGDRILIQKPVYHPFANSIASNNRVEVNSPLVYKDGKYSIDFDDFEKKIVESDVKMFILCSPHNPVGKVWTKEELTRMGDICLQNNVIIVSDEIHCDFVDPTIGRKHHVFGSISEESLQHSIICTAPSKTFNIAGLQTSNIIIANENMRETFASHMKKIGIGGTNMLGMIACQAAYESGREWLDELNLYLKGNRDFIREYLQEYIPNVRFVEPDGLFLLWLDFSSLGMTQKDLVTFLEEKANVWMNDGTGFGAAEGIGFMRMNIGSSRSYLKTAMDNMRDAIGTL